jgi:four helix bundle protein
MRWEDMRRGQDIAGRLLKLGVAVVHLARRVKKDSATRHLASQMVRAATSAGANYHESRSAESCSDFVHEIGIALKELREAHYWLRLAHRAGIAGSDIEPLLQEADELVSILFASRRTAARR